MDRQQPDTRETAGLRATVIVLAVAAGLALTVPDTAEAADPRAAASDPSASRQAPEPRYQRINPRFQGETVFRNAPLTRATTAPAPIQAPQQSATPVITKTTVQGDARSLLDDVITPRDMLYNLAVHFNAEPAPRVECRGHDVTLQDLALSGVHMHEPTLVPPGGRLPRTKLAFYKAEAFFSGRVVDPGGECQGETYFGRLTMVRLVSDSGISAGGAWFVPEWNRRLVKRR